jgi:hypothetical protein
MGAEKEYWQWQDKIARTAIRSDGVVKRIARSPGKLVEMDQVTREMSCKDGDEGGRTSGNLSKIGGQSLSS